MEKYEYKPDFRSYKEKVYDEILNNLLENEIIIKQISENGYEQNYNVMYLTNMSNSFYGQYNKENIHIKKLIYKNSEILADKYLKNIIKHDFKIGHYGKMNNKLDEFIKLIDSIEL